MVCTMLFDMKTIYPKNVAHMLRFVTGGTFRTIPELNIVLIIRKLTSN